MNSPETVHCLICDDGREEVRGKLALLGFYGVAPDVTVNVAELGLPILQLTFVFVVKGLTAEVAPVKVNDTGFVRGQIP